MAGRQRKTSDEKAKTQDEAAAEERSPAALPERIFAQASPRSAGGVSMFEAQGQIAADTVANFLSEDDLLARAAARLAEAGFEVLQVSRLTINIAGTAETYRRAFDTDLVARELPTMKAFGEETTAAFLDSPETALRGLIATEGTAFEDVLEGVAIEEPRYFMVASAFPPLRPYWHLRVPGEVGLALNADRAHRGGTTGRGVRVAMVDSGWFRHPYFVARGYRAAPVVLGPGAANPLRDESGHGTGESANVFAVAPDAELLPVKMSFVNSIGAFNAAVGLNPQVITCSWGSDNRNGPLSAADQALAAAIAAAVAAGIVVVFSAGNGHWGFPGQHPDVISAGGVFMNPDGTLRASDYASGFLSNIYPGRRVPDLSGLVGMRPRAAYLMLPVEPGDQLDTQLAGGTHPNADETANNDGWAAFSGTSAAAPQLAGAAALVRQVCPGLTPAAVRNVLMTSARDVTTGTTHPNTGPNTAVVGPDAAVGNGLLDAHRAVLIAKLRCLGPVQPVAPQPVTPLPPRPPIEPIRPEPIEPVRPRPPIEPIRPRPPIEPIRPVGPQPIEPPLRPIRPQPVGPAGALFETAEGAPSDPTAGAPPTAGLSQEDVAALEEIVMEGDLDLDL